MKSTLIGKSLLIWVGIIPLAILNGGIREYILYPFLGTLSLPFSGILLCLMIFYLCFVFIPRLGQGTPQIYILIGLLWLLLTVSFEFLFGLLNGESIQNLLLAYNIFTGNLWLLVLLFTTVAPYLCAKLHKII